MRLIAILLLMVSVPALAEPEATILMPTSDVVTSPGLRGGFLAEDSVFPVMAGEPLEMIANSLHSSNVAVHVVDATHGPLPINREFILLARQARTPHSVVLIANVDRLFKEVGPEEGAHFLALEEEVTRETLELYGIGGSDTAVYHDSQDASRGTATMAGGRDQFLADLASMDRGSRPVEGPVMATEAVAEVYLLTRLEAPEGYVSLTPSKALQLWTGGQMVDAEISVDGAAYPGENVRVRVRTAEPLSVALAGRFLLIDDNHIAGVGVVAEIP